MRKLRELAALPPDKLDVQAVAEAISAPIEIPDDRLNRLRVVRNACAVGQGVQTLVLSEKPQFMNSLKEEVLNMAGERPADDNLELTLALQCLHNAYVGQHDVIKRDVDDLSRVALACIKDEAGAKVRGLAAAVARLVLAVDTIGESLMSKLSPRQFGILLRDARDNEFAALASSSVVLSSTGAHILRSHFDSLDGEERAAVLELTTSLKGKASQSNLATDWALFAAERFKRLATTVMVTLKTAPESADPSELMAALDTLGHFSAYAGQGESADGGEKSGEELTDPGQALRQDKSLLIDAVYLLRMAHQAGKEDATGLLAPVSRAADMVDEASTSVEMHPVYGLKSHLVRLVGNLCWQHRGNQDQAREIEAIQLLLDCCAIDAKNPLMIQWVVFALRNLCRDNEENQRLLASVDGAGVAVHTLEKEFGLTSVSDRSNK